ncbi:MAG: undecaprenyl-diphosphate phosphatase [Mycobacteriales bacterium]
MSGALLAASGGCLPDAAFDISTLQAAVLGITQGLTEFLPISSSGHLIVVPWAFGWDEIYCAEAGNKFFDIALHIGTFVGAALYLRRDLSRLIRAFFASLSARSVTTQDQRMAWYLVLATIPAALIGAVLEGPITEHLGKPWQIAILLAIFGVLLYVVDTRVVQETPYDGMTRNQALGMGVAQALALAPGVSRSGATITAARAMGVTRDAAARFSFLLSLPITLGAALYSAVTLGDTGGLDGQGTQFAVGIVFSGISGALAVWGVLRIIRTRSYGDFALYRVVAAAAILIAIATGVRPGSF